MSRLVLGPFNRVEGDLEVTLDIDGGRIRSARVNSPLYRGFEQILAGKDPRDALVFVPRICGICSVSQSAAAAAALRDAMGIRPPPNGERAASLVLATENLADHFTHFYLFFMADFAREAYAGRRWFDAAQARFKAVKGSAAADALPARAAFLQMMGLLAGKWPHSLSLQPGGSARAISSADKIRLFALLSEFRSWLERRLFGDRLEVIAALDSAQALDNWQAARAPASSDFRLFLEIADDLRLQDLGRASDLFISNGAYTVDQAVLFARGRWQLGEQHARPLDPASITEDVHSAWMADSPPLHPHRGQTLPDADKPDAYTWCKAPRLDGAVAECGALARQLVDGHPLMRDLAVASGGNVRNRVIARLLEFARVIPAMEQWIREIQPGEPFCTQGTIPDEAESCGLVEAARGALGHWLVIRKGRIANYQIIAPTTWNFSPRDAGGTPGPLEQALAGIAIGEHERVPLAVQHVVRSFDPCMVCTVH